MAPKPKVFVVWDLRYPELQQIAEQVADLYPVVWLRRNGDPLAALRQAVERAEILFALSFETRSLELEFITGFAWASGLAYAGLGWELGPLQSMASLAASNWRHMLGRAIAGRHVPPLKQVSRRPRRLFIGHGPQLADERQRRRKAGWDTVDRIPYDEDWVAEEIVERARSATELVWVRTERDTPQYAQLAGAALATGCEIEVLRGPGAVEIGLLSHVERIWDESALSSDRRLRTDLDELRVEALRLDNFRGIERLEVSFRSSTSLPGDWTCIAGINGAGKSTILQALALVLLGEELGRDLQSDRLQSFRRRDHDGNVYNAEITADIKIGEQRETLGLRIDDDGLSMSFEGRTPPSRMGQIWHQRSRAQVLVSYGASRNLASYRDNRYDAQAAEVRRQMSLFDPHAQLLEASVFHARDEAHPQLQRSLAQLLSTVLEGTDLNVSEELYFVLDDGTRVTASDLPDGFRSMVAWLGDLCASWINKGNATAPTEIAAIVLIDEIDLHLHPSLQRSLIPNLRRALPRVQWVVTTHSPLIISSFDRTEIRALDRSAEDGTGIRTLDRQILGFSTDQVYAWLMGVTPHSAAIDDELQRLEAGNSEMDRAELARVLRQTPEVSAEEAALLEAQTRELLAELDEDGAR